MKLLKFMMIVQLSCTLKAFQNESIPTTTTTTITAADVQVKNTTGHKQDEFNRDPVVQPVHGRCSWNFSLPGTSSRNPVMLTSHAAHSLADQICRELDCGGVFHINATSTTSSDSPPNSTCLHNCSYAHGRLQNCSHTGGSDCTVIVKAVCANHAVRLADGSGHCDGRVELWRDGRWGSVCDDQWSLRDADVVCAQLRCGYALTVTGQGGPFPPGRGPVYRDELNCTGTEENLWACPAARDESDCGHKEDAGVVCSEMRAVRLRGGLDRCSGVLEVHRNGSWGTVCDNGWNKNMASMVCSMLQCGTDPLNYTRFDPPLKHNNGTRYFYDCGPKDQNLWQCHEFISSHLCQDSKASGLICNGSLGFPQFTTENVTEASESTATPTTAAAADVAWSVSPELLSTIVLSLLLLVFVITNTVLCCLYRRRHEFLLRQSRSSPRQPPSERQQNNYDDGGVDLVKVSSHPVQSEAPPPRYLWTQLSSVDSTSVDTDYEQFDPNNDPTTPLSTFNNSQRYKPDFNCLMKPPGLDSVCEGPEPSNDFTNYNGSTDPQCARVSKISVDSFDTSSTSSGECYENVSKSHAAADPEPGQSLVGDGGFDPSGLGDMDPNRFYPIQTSDEDNDDHIYSPVSPD